MYVSTKSTDQSENTALSSKHAHTCIFADFCFPEVAYK